MPRAGLVGLSRGAPWRVERLWRAPEAVVPRGLAVSRSGRHVLVANGAGGLLVASSEPLLGGEEDPVVAVLPGPARESMQVVLDPAERFAFVSDEDGATVSVFDFGDSLGSRSPEGRLVGQVPVPAGPVGLARTPDGVELLVTSQGGGGDGALSLIGVAEAAADPRRARVRSVPAGWSPVRVAVSPDGAIAWVTARGSNSLLAFDLSRLRAGDDRALRAVVRVGSAPVGLALLAGGSRVIVANSNRYGSDRGEPQTLAVLDAQAALAGRDALLGTVPVGAFPRELIALGDDRSLLVTNVVSQTLQEVLGGVVA
jgi:DNA-binding beta-propeller fold protein YncE